MAYNPNMRKAVPSYPGWEADEDGKVYRDGIEVSGWNSHGYVYVMQSVKRGHLVALAFHGFKPQIDMELRHLNDIKYDDRPVNLAWGTHSENIADAHRNGLMYRNGIANPCAKLHEIDVMSIRDDYASGEFSMFKLGIMYGVNKSTISDIVRRRKWVHV